MRVKFRTLIALHSFTTTLGLESLMWWKESEPEVESSKLSLNRLDLMVLKLAKAAGPGFALSAPELSDRMNLRPAQIQECLDKLSQNDLLDFTRGTTDGYENYRLNETGAYILTMWQEYQARFIQAVVFVAGHLRRGKLHTRPTCSLDTQLDDHCTARTTAAVYIAGPAKGHRHHDHESQVSHADRASQLHDKTWTRITDVVERCRARSGVK